MALFSYRNTYRIDGYSDGKKATGSQAVSNCFTSHSCRASSLDERAKPVHFFSTRYLAPIELKKDLKDFLFVACEFNTLRFVDTC